jgi:hypothetical protein
VGVVNEAVEDGVGISRVADKGVPFVDGDLTGEDGRAVPIAFLEDLVEVTTSTGVERFEAPIVEDEELDAGETTQNAGIATVTAGERELGEELGNPLIENRAVVAAGLVTQGTSKPRFAHSGRPAQDQIVVRVDTAILPARPRRPRDKAKVEVAVLIIERWLLGRLRRRSFYSLAELNTAIGELLRQLNGTPAVYGTAAEPRTLTMRLSSTLTVRLQVSGQSKVQTLARSSTAMWSSLLPRR